MSDDIKPTNQQPQIVSGRPLDPTRNASDLIGDTTGLTGITTGSPQLTSATPDEKNVDTSHLPGSTLNEVGQTPQAVGQNPALLQDDTTPPVNTQMSSTYLKQANDIASDDTDTTLDNTPDMPADMSQSIKPNDDTSSFASSINSQSPSVQGEQSLSGDMPDPDSDDDTLANAQAAGFQLDEDTENPKELNMGADIDRAVQAIKES